MSMPGQGQGSTDFLPAQVRPDDTAYVCFTSGSIGLPKGCRNTHASFCSSTGDWLRQCQIGRDSRVFQWSSFAFDVSVLDILGGLMGGTTICKPSEMERLNDLEGALNRYKATYVTITPSAALCLSPAKLPHLEMIVPAGEAVPLHLIREWHEHVRVVNGYGPCECSVISHAEHNASKIQTGSIGKPVCGRGWVMDRLNPDRPAALGALGELLIEGPHVGAGYVNDAAQTAEKFGCLPASLAKLVDRTYATYRSGDLARYTEDGAVIFSGRADQQVKIRG